MTRLANADYYVERERHERGMAARASDPAIARIHLDMAEHYASLVQPASDVMRTAGMKPSA